MYEKKKKFSWLRILADVAQISWRSHLDPPQPHWHSHLESLPFAPQPPAQSQHGKEVRREEAFK